MSKTEKPRGLRDHAERLRRKELLCLPHIVPLTKYVATLRKQERGQVPEFDPLDGGTHAQALFLFEKPGPMTDDANRGQRSGSGFISRDNDDPTAEATSRFMKEAGIPRRLSLIWNSVPWWNGTRRITGSEARAGAAALGDLIVLLPDLKVIMLVGSKAKRAGSLLVGNQTPLMDSPHPSPVVRASRPELWKSIPERWASIKPLLYRI